VPVRIIDKSPHPSDKSQALGIHARTLEVFHDLGIVDAVITAGVKLRAVHIYVGDRRLVRLAFGGLKTSFRVCT